MARELTCFLIDDDTEDQEIFEMALNDASDNYTCITAKNGCEAIQKLTGSGSFIPDYIFIDLNMPLMGGKQFLTEVRKFSKFDHALLVICSTSSSSRDIDETLKLGAAHYIVKPSSMSQLTNILEQLFYRESLPFLLNKAIERY